MPARSMKNSPSTATQLSPLFRCSSVALSVHSTMFITGDGNNRTGWSNPTYDGLISEAAREADPARRFEIFATAERILISQDVPICPLYYYVGIQFYDGDRLGGIESNLLDEHPLKLVFWKKR